MRLPGIFDAICNKDWEAVSEICRTGAYLPAVILAEKNAKWKFNDFGTDSQDLKLKNLKGDTALFEALSSQAPFAVVKELVDAFPSGSFIILFYPCSSINVISNFNDE